MGTIGYNVAALCILLLDFYLFFARSRLRVVQTRVFFFILICTLFATVLDIVTVAIYSNGHHYPVFLPHGVNLLYFLFQTTVPLIFFFFLISLSGIAIPRSWALRILICVPWLVTTVLIVTNPFTRLLFYYTDTGYFRGRLIPLIYAIALNYIFFGLLFLFQRRKQVSIETKAGILLFISVGICAVIIQFLYPLLRVQNLGVSISSLLVLITVQDFGKYLEHVTKLFNRNGLTLQLGLLMQKRIPIVVFLVSLDTVNFLRLVLGPDVFTSLEREISVKLFGFAREHRFAAAVGQGRYILVTAEREGLEEERERLIRSFTNPWFFRERILSVPALLCEIRIPEDTDDIAMVFQAQYELSRTPGRYKHNNVIPFGDLSLANSDRFRYVSRFINKALVSDGFTVVFQPIVLARTGKVHAAEALIRLNNTPDGPISPAEFIPIAEQNGAIHRIGDLVVREACIFLNALRAQGASVEFVEVNLSPIQCLQANLSKRILSIVQEYGLKPADICLEVTETAANRSSGSIKRNLDSLVLEGFSIAVDDFGTGYSNISGLMDLPFSIVKLDRSLIEAMDRSENGRLGLEGVVSMFQHMNNKLVAEGIETEEQALQLNDMNIDYIQGYFYSRPLCTDDFIQFLYRERKQCTG